MKIKVLSDLRRRARQVLHTLNTSHVDPASDQMISPRVPELAEARVSEARGHATVRIHQLSRHIWAHAGLNRKERRTLDAQLRKGAVQPVEGSKFRVKRQPLSAEARKLAKFYLKNSPPNSPAHIDRNSKLATNNPIYAAFAAQRGVQVVE